VTVCLSALLGKFVGALLNLLLIGSGQTADASLFRVWLSYTFNNLQVTDGCVSPSKYVQVMIIMGCIVGCGDILAAMRSE